MLQTSVSNNSKIGNISKKLSTVLVLLSLGFTSLGVTSCDSMSDNTKDQGKNAICAAGGGLVSQIRTGGAVGKFVAGVVSDNSTGDIKILADKVANGEGGEQAAVELANYVDSLCN